MTEPPGYSGGTPTLEGIDTLPNVKIDTLITAIPTNGSQILNVEAAR
jgi:hypothetical protein